MLLSNTFSNRYRPVTESLAASAAHWIMRSCVCITFGHVLAAPSGLTDAMKAYTMHCNNFEWMSAVSPARETDRSTASTTVLVVLKDGYEEGNSLAERVSYRSVRYD